MNVKIIASTPNPELIAAVAARTCYSADNSDTIMSSLTDDKIKKLLQKVIKSGHHSVLEQASFTFSVEGVSRVLLAQLTRHRIASFAVQSQRYVNMENFHYIIPESILVDKKINNDNKMLNKYLKFLDEAKALYKEMIDQGIKPEDARYMLPGCVLTNIVMTMNARELLHFFSLRCCNRAQKEIRSLANEMLKLVKPLAPNIFANAGPNCVRGFCTEEKSCGKLWAKKEKKI